MIPLRWRGKSAVSLRRLYGTDKAAALEFLDRDPVNAVLARVNVERMGLGPASALAKYNDAQEITALAWDGGNVIPLGFTPAGLDELADSLLSRRRIASSFVGPATQVMGLWERTRHDWGPARDIRSCQLSMVMDRPSAVAPDSLVRPARFAEAGLVLPASVAMFTEEVGYDPMIYGNSYAHRVSTLISAGHTFVRVENDALTGQPRVIFKADIGALAGGVAQIQGVWTAPDRRGQGIATHAMAAVVSHILENIAPTVSLYVNNYNLRAVQVYKKVGFTRREDWATILL
ncbi:Predicted acetyltransferase [Actinobaculum suis]|uniref:Predicted acetyltransferase n=1 Tax=Actinobaculum suis TaxID=1657 RepID=A0A7Z8Y9J1_9ACTO|nr:DUF4081 domain-containing GNAT family N-acetyltransferase [Actinobaculum suis]VDG76811.1 Predicted acetyltransferase [Actinobaculum suis]